MKYDVIIVASGKGLRAGLGYNKVFYRMKDGKRVIDHSLELFGNDEDCERIIVVTNEEFIDELKDENVILVKGGKERKDSVRNGLDKATSEYVFIHDGARPFLRKESLEALKEKVVETDAALLGRMAFDTIKEVKDGKVVRTLDRRNIFLAETPQAFRVL